MREFARRNAGVAAAVGVYGVLAAAGVVAVQQMSTRQGTPPLASPPSPPASPVSPTPTRPVRTPSPQKRPTAPDVGRTVVAAESAQRTGHSSNGGGGGAGGGSPTRAPTSRPRPTATSTPPATTPTGCQAGRVVAVQLPLGVLPCDTVRVGRAVTIGGTKK